MEWEFADGFFSVVCNSDRIGRILNSDYSGRNYRVLPFRRPSGVRRLSVLSELQVGQSDLHSVDGIDGRIPGRRAAQCRHMRIGNKAHVHQMILNRFWQVQSDQDPALANL
jgi:hypothetical protein